MYERRWFYSVINSGLDTLSFSGPLLMTWQLTGICEGASCTESSLLSETIYIESHSKFGEEAVSGDEERNMVSRVSQSVWSL